MLRKLALKTFKGESFQYQFHGQMFYTLGPKDDDDDIYRWGAITVEA